MDHGACQSAAEISCREADYYQACRLAGEEASPDHGDSRDRSTTEPIFPGQARRCWLRAAFAVALDCAATGAGERAWQTGGTARTEGEFRAGRRKHKEALAEFSAAGRLQSQLAGSHAVASRLACWTE
jgi:hypothetical protein